ncbi:MAG: AMP-binding protein [Planctomycetes bacterium]|nr:AMP-binding protein [Planctomycetota bacterium]
MSFLEVIVDALARDPARVAVVQDQGATVTAGALLRRAAQVRAGLRARGVVPGDRVALLGGNAPDWIACDLAVLAEGAALVPLDPRQDAADRQRLLADADARVVITLDPAAGLPGAVSVDALAAQDAEWTAPAALPGTSPATIIYTSGTSGEPKGAVLTRANLDFMLEHTTMRLARLSGEPWGAERVVQVLPLCYAGSRVLLLSSLQRGARVRLVADPKRLGAALEEEAPHYALTVPLILERMRRAVHERVAARGAAPGRLLVEAEAAWARLDEGGRSLRDRAVVGLCRWLVLRKVRARIAPSLRGIICGSAPLLPEHQRFFTLLGVEVYQGYGLTETTALCTLDVEGQVRAGFVGPALPGVEMKTDEQGQLVVRGPNVFAGYWRRPPGTGLRDGWFETGDLGDVDAQGRWRITGRRSAVLVLATGHKVPPEPVEDGLRLLLAAEGAGDAQVVLVGQARPHLAALIAGATREQAAAAVARHNAASEPKKRVHAFHVLDAPLTTESGLLTPNLKLRRAAILERFAADLERLYAGARVAVGS